VVVVVVVVPPPPLLLETLLLPVVQLYQGAVPLFRTRRRHRRPSFSQCSSARSL
jgi:hypothetical protein